MRGVSGWPCRRLEAWLTKKRTRYSASGYGSSCCCGGYWCSTGCSTTTTARCSRRSCSRWPPRIPPPMSRCGSTPPADRSRPCSPSAMSCGWCRATSRPWRSGWPAAPGSSCCRPGRKGKRFALPHARILMHRGSAGIGGSAVDIEVQADDLRHTVDTVLGLIAEDTGQPVQRIFDDSLHDHWYTAAEARDYGFIDGIVGLVRPGHAGQKRRIGLQGQRAESREQLHHPERHRPASARRADHGRVLASAHRAHRLPRHGHRSRRGQRAHRPAAAPGGGEPRAGDQPVHQLRGRRPAVHARHLRHHAVHPGAGRDHLRGPGHRRRRRAARGRARPAGGRCCRTRGWCCTSLPPAARDRSRT